MELKSASYVQATYVNIPSGVTDHKVYEREGGRGGRERERRERKRVKKERDRD